MTTLLKPGILVSLKTTLNGGVRYHVEDLAPPDETPSDGLVTRWETTKVVDDPTEHEQATRVRASAAATIRAVCANTAFGLLCPESKAEELDAAIEAARTKADAFNAGSNYSKVGVFVLKGRIASSDLEATRAIASEIASLLDDMDQGIRGADPKAIREAATRARQLGAILDDQQGKAVSDAVDAAREAARAIVKRIQKNGEVAETVLAELNTTPIDTARFAFLDLDMPTTEKAPAIPAVALQRFDDTIAESDDDNPEPSKEPDTLPPGSYEPPTEFNPAPVYAAKWNDADF